MVAEEFSPTGPKIHPERAQREAVGNFLNRCTDISEALLALTNPMSLNFVRVNDIENADAMARDRGIPYLDAAKQAQNNILDRFMPQFTALQNKYQIGVSFLEQYLRQKVETDWFSTEIRDLELDGDDFHEQVRKMQRRYPDPDFQGELVDMMRPMSANLMLNRKYMFSQAKLIELYMELGNHIRRN
ncbi:hypothetical protein HY969_05090 [Candidatus Kaiserbacteria bacterium]|nr:hypothetical protein [Candidatus Kaiserbacteria bacterium]